MKRDAMGWTHEMMLGEVKREKVRDRPGCMMVIALQNAAREPRRTRRWLQRLVGR